MSDSFLVAVAARAADVVLSSAKLAAVDGLGTADAEAFNSSAAFPTLSADETCEVLRCCDVLTRLRVAAVVCKSWQELTRRPDLYTTVSLPIHMTRGGLVRFAVKFCGEHTTKLNLRNMRNLRNIDRSLSTSALQRMLVANLFRESSADWEAAPPATPGELVATTIEGRTSGTGPRARMPHLQVLDLSANALDDSVFGSLHGTCVTVGMLRCFAQLRRLSLFAVTGLTTKTIHLLAGHCPKLETLDLRMCGEVDYSGVCHLASYCPVLADVRLKGLRGLNDDTVTALGQLCPRLTHLDLSRGSRPTSGGCSDVGIQALAAACPRLEKLILAGCKSVGNDGVIALAISCPALKILDLQGCSTVGDAAAHALAAHCASLHTISFQCCATLSDAGFEEICRRCPLRHITLKLTAVTPEAIEAMRAHGEADSERRGGPLTVVDFTVPPAPPPVVNFGDFRSLDR